MCLNDVEKYYDETCLEDLSRIVSETFDVVLCMGPIYHLPDEEDRYRVLKECLKVLKEGGLLFVSFISAYAPIIDFIKNYPEKVTGWKDKLLNYLKDGRNVVSPDNPGFTTAFFMRPDHIEGFMSSFNIGKIVLTGVEGLPAQSESRLYSLPEDAYQEWLDIIYHTSRDPVTWGACEHFLFIGRKV